VAAVFESV